MKLFNKNVIKWTVFSFMILVIMIGFYRVLSYSLQNNDFQETTTETIEAVIIPESNFITTIPITDNETTASCSLENEIETTIEIQTEESTKIHKETTKYKETKEETKVEPTETQKIEVETFEETTINFETTEENSESELESEPETTEKEDEWVSLGTFKITFYCACRTCNGRWYGQPTASGTDYVEGRTIAVDKRVISLGSEVKIEDWGTYVAEDTGVKGDHIDIFLDSHSEGNKYGVQYKEVWVKK